MRLALLVVVVVVVAFADASLFNRTVSTPLGSIKGQCDSDHGWCSYLGIPFGSDTSGSKRWTGAKIAPSWAPNVLEALEFGPVCPQKSPWPTPVPADRPTSENCLTLNIWTPLNFDSSNPKVPVMVWVHGGGFIGGTASDPAWLGFFLANTSSINPAIPSNVIVVTIEYRLGALGFLNIPGELSGNYGFLDQQLALLWVKSYIGSFNGDASKVTIVGQSAGAMSVMLHLVSPLSRGLFSGAIMESNLASLLYRTEQNNQPYAEKFAKNLGCNVTDVACLRSASVDDIIKYSYGREWIIDFPLNTKEFFAWEPVIDGFIIPDQPFYMVQKGQLSSNVPVMVGTVTNETARFIPDVVVPTEAYKALVNSWFGSVSASVLKEYPAPFLSDCRSQLDVLSTDYLFVCSDRNMSLSLARNAPVFVYQFFHTPGYDPINHNNKGCLTVPCHSSEIPYVFHSQSFVPGATWTPQESDLSFTMMTFWLQFIHGKFDTTTGIQGLNGLTWPAFSGKTLPSMGFDLTSGTVSAYRQSFCDFWDKTGYTF